MVQSLGETTYNEVADQLVAEIVGDKCEANSQSEERNVRRCVTPGPFLRLGRAHVRHAEQQRQSVVGEIFGLLPLLKAAQQRR